MTILQIPSAPSDCGRVFFGRTNSARFQPFFMYRPASPEHLPRDDESVGNEHLDADLSVPMLAKRAGMSDRNFSRVFSQQVGTKPARFAGRLRLQAAKASLEGTTDNVETIASRAGFGDGETLRRRLRSESAKPRRFRARIGLQSLQGAALRSVPGGNPEL